MLDLPIGTIVQWARYTGRARKTGIPTLFLKHGWLECNGQKITKGKLRGKNTPDLSSFANNILTNLSDDSIINFVFMMKCWHKNKEVEEDGED